MFLQRKYLVQAGRDFTNHVTVFTQRGFEKQFDFYFIIPKAEFSMSQDAAL